MDETPDPTAAATYGQLELQLLRRASFTSGYLPQMIDYIVEQTTGSHTTFPDAHEAAQIHSKLAGIAAQGQPGGRELARLMLNIRHAAQLVRHDHYRASAVPKNQHDTVVAGAELRELAAEAGRERVTAAQGGVLVVSQDDGTSIFFRPVTAPEAQALSLSFNSGFGGAKADAPRPMW